MTHNTINGNNETIEQIKQHHKDKAFDQSIKLSEELLSIPQELEKPQRYQALYHLGHGLKAQKNIIQAKEVFTSLDQDYSHRFEGLQGLFQIASNEKDWQTAIEIGKDCVERFPRILQGYHWLGQGLKNTGQYDEAKKIFSTACDMFPNHHYGVEGLLQVAEKQKDWQTIFTLAPSFIEKVPKRWEGYWWLGQAYKNLNEYDKAEKQFKRMQEKFPNRHHGYLGLLQTSVERQSWADVETHANTFKQKFPNMIQGHFWLGHAYKNQGDLVKAETAFEETLERFPQHNQGFMGLLNLAHTQQDHQNALTISQQLMDKFPKQPQGYWWAGQAYKNLGDYEKAKHTFATLQQTLPNNHQGWEGMVHTAQHQQDWQQAIEHAKLFTEKFPNLWQSYWHLGQAYKNLAEYDKAEEQFRLLQEKFPNQHQSWEGMINLCQIVQNHEKIIKVSQNFIELFPLDARGYCWKGEAYQQLGQYQKAMEIFLQFDKNIPNNYLALEKLINVSIQKADWQQATKYRTALQKRFPDIESDLNVEYYQILSTFDIPLTPKKPLTPEEERLVSKFVINHPKTNKEIINKRQKITGNNVAIFSANFGDREPLAHWSLLENVDYYCFTDKFGLENHGVTLLPPDYYENDHKRNSLYYKTNGIHYFGAYDLIIWCDQNVNILNLISINHVADNSVIASFTHWSRDCLYDEAEVIINLQIDKMDVVNQQITQYREEGFPEHYGLFETNVMAYQSSEVVKKLMQAWWAEIIRGSKRDQLSFTYVLWKLDVVCQPLEADMLTARNGSSYQYNNH